MEFFSDGAFNIPFFNQSAGLIDQRTEFRFVLQEQFLKIADKMRFGMLPEQAVLNDCRRYKKGEGNDQDTVFINLPKHLLVMIWFAF